MILPQPSNDGPAPLIQDQGTKQVPLGDIPLVSAPPALPVVVHGQAPAGYAREYTRNVVSLFRTVSPVGVNAANQLGGDDGR